MKGSRHRRGTKRVNRRKMRKTRKTRKMRRRGGAPLITSAAPEKA
jgi:hypothetical protein